MTPCTNCGHIPTMQTSFCPQCGATMTAGGATSTPAAPVPQQPVNPQGPTVAWRADDGGSAGAIAGQSGEEVAAQPTISPRTSSTASTSAAPYTAAAASVSGGVLESDEQPPNAIIPLILSFVCFMCCWPAAIGAMLTAIFAMTNASSGNIPTAKLLTKISYAISITAMALFFLAMCGYAGLVFVSILLEGM